MGNPIKARTIRPFLRIKWWFARKRSIRSLECRTIKDILDKRDEIYTRYLKQDREGDAPGKKVSQSKIEALDWVLMRKES